MEPLSLQEQAVFGRLAQTLSKSLEMSPDDFTLDFDLFHQIDTVDSLDMAELSVLIEGHLGVWVEPNDIRKVRSMLDLVKLVTPLYLASEAGASLARP